MFERDDTTEEPMDELFLEALLRSGLREIPAPVFSADFSERILQSIRRSRPWWWIDWSRERFSLLAAASAASVACLGTLAMILWTGGAGPIRISPDRAMTGAVAGAVQTALQAADQGQMTAATLLLRSPRTRSEAGRSPSKSAPASPAAGSGGSSERR
jgi:hypothetical protein